jgi:hypothetical protein
MIFLSMPSVAAPDKIERYVSAAFLPDQIAVYSYIISSYRTLLKRTYRDMLAKVFYLDEETGPLDMKELKPGRGCLKGLEFEPIPKEQIPTVHRLSQQKWLPSYVKLVSGAPCKGSATAGMCYETEGTLSLSEIAFDKSHTYALVGFSVRCGLQCGWGRVMILERVDGHWQQTKRICGEWYI